MIGIGNIKINADGKTSDQIKKEIMEQVNEQVDVMLKEVEKKNKKEEDKPSFIKLSAIEDEAKKGYNVEVDFEGDTGDILTMLTVMVSEALHDIVDDEEDQYSAHLIKDFTKALVAEYTTAALSNPKEEEK